MQALYIILFLFFHHSPAADADFHSHKYQIDFAQTVTASQINDQPASANLNEDRDEYSGALRKVNPVSFSAGKNSPDLLSATKPSVFQYRNQKPQRLLLFRICVLRL